MSHRASFVLFLPLALAFTGDADAVIRQDIQNAAGNCQAALPVFDGQIRKRPLAIGNEGTGPAFVSCSLVGDYSAMANTILTQVIVRNRGSETQSIACSMVAGFEHGAAPAPLYVARSIELAPGAEGIISWNVGDNGEELLPGPINFSCLLPAATVINLTLRAYDEVVAP